VRCRMGSARPGTAARLELSSDTPSVPRIFTLFTAFFQSCLPDVGLSGVVGLFNAKPVSFTIGELIGVGGTRGDAGVESSLMTAVTSEARDLKRLVGSCGSELSRCGAVVGRAFSTSSTSFLNFQQDTDEIKPAQPWRTDFRKLFVCRDATLKALIRPKMPGSCRNLSLASERMSFSHFWPRCRENAHLSDANQAETAARPKDVKAVRTVVIVDVTRA
jgi:hypothetical protein